MWKEQKSLNRFLSTGRARRKHRIAHTTTGAAQPGTIVGTVYTTGSTTTRRQAPTHPLFSTNARSTRQTYVIFGICDTLCAYLRKYTICKKIVLCRLHPVLGILPPLPPAEAECRPWQSAAAPLLHLLPCHPSTNSIEPSSNKVIYAWNGSCLHLAPIHRVDHPLNSDQPPPAK